MSEFDFTFKFVLVGKTGVGKTCICKVFCENEFYTTPNSTVGLDFDYRVIDINGASIKLLFWDTSGQERFKSINSSYYRTASAVFAVFDVSNRESFVELSYWVDEISKLAPNVIKVIVGNKVDLIQKRVVSEAEALEYADSNGFRYFETSALSGSRIEDTFYSTADLVYRTLLEDSKNNHSIKDTQGGTVQELTPIRIEYGPSRLRSHCC